jgi:hypothetical protein
MAGQQSMVSKSSRTCVANVYKETGNKEINALNLVRMGLAMCTSSGFVRRAKYGVNWRMKSLAELKPLYEKVLQYLLGTEYGEFLAMKEIFGEDVAIRVAMNGEMKVPAFITRERQHGIQNGEYYK